MKLIALTQGKFAEVDDDLFQELSKFKWCAARRGKTFYAERRIGLPNGKSRLWQMHREVLRLLGEVLPKEVDHKDRNGLNNQRDNLRAATRSDQMRNRSVRKDNTSGYIGVSRKGNKWQAQTNFNGKRKSIGIFDDAFSAAWKYDEFIKFHHPEFGAINNLADRRRVAAPVKLERRLQ